MAQIYISLGSNINPQHNVKVGIEALKKAINVTAISTIYESKSIGFLGNNFLNLVIKAQTLLSVNDLIILFKTIEIANGRAINAKKFSSRTLDIDLLLYDDLIIALPTKLPRPEIATNAFVLLPLAEIAPDKIHPITQLTYQQMWQNFDKSSQCLWPISI